MAIQSSDADRYGFNERRLPATGRVPELEDATLAPDEGAIEEENELKAIEIVKADIERGRAANEAEKGTRMSNYDAYRAKGDGKAERPGHSRVKCSDIMDTIEWMMPSFIKAFASSTECISVSPQGAEDVTKAEKLQKLLNWQFMGSRCNGFTVLYEWIKACLIYGTSIVKVTWQDIYVKKGFDVPMLSDSQIQSMNDDDDVKDLQATPVDIQPGMVLTEDILKLAETSPELIQMIGQANSETMGVQPVAMQQFRVWRDVKGKKMIKQYSGPIVEVISPEDFYMDPEAKTIEEAQFVIHRVWRTYGYLRKKEQEGIYKNVESVKQWIADNKDSFQDSENAERYASAGQVDTASLTTGDDDKQIARKKLEVFEWWGLLDLNGEGYQEPYLIVYCGETILRMELNPYGHGQAPFEVLRPMLDPFKFSGVSIPEMVGEFQAIKTALFRQMLDNVSYQNNGAWLVNRNAGVDMNALLHMRPNTIIRTNITTGAVQPLTPPNLQGYPLQMVDLVDSMLQKRTGVTSYNQGIDANSLNKTATGITKIMDASNQRTSLMSRIMAETGVRRLFQKILMLNQQFMDQTIVVRIFNKPIEISPDDIAGEFDVSVDVGGATGRDETRIQQMMMLMQYATMLMSMGVMRPTNIYEISRKMMEIWGWKDYEKYLSDPGEIEALKQGMMMIEQLGAMVQNGQAPDPQVIVQAFQQLHQILQRVLGANAQTQGQQGVPAKAGNTNPQGGAVNGGQPSSTEGGFTASRLPGLPNRGVAQTPGNNGSSNRS